MEQPPPDWMAAFPPGAPPTLAQSGQPRPERTRPTPVDTSLKVDSILTQEFMHASGSAHQLRDHSNGLFNFFLVAAGVTSTGLGVIVNAYTSGDRTTLEVLQILILLACAVLGFVIFVRFFRLGQEYRENLLTLNLIKEFYVSHLRQEMPEIDRAFRSPSRVRHDAEAMGTNGILGVTIAGLGSLCAAGAVGHFLGLLALLRHWDFAHFTSHAFGVPPFAWETFAFFLALAAQIVYYRARLKKPKESVI